MILSSASSQTDHLQQMVPSLEYLLNTLKLEVG
jgi:hypothetical protein